MPGATESDLLGRLRMSASDAQTRGHNAHRLCTALQNAYVNLLEAGADETEAQLKGVEPKLDKANAKLKEAKAELKEAEARLDKAKAELVLAEARLAFVGQLHSRVCVRAIPTRTMLNVGVCSGMGSPTVWRMCLKYACGR